MNENYCDGMRFAAAEVGNAGDAGPPRTESGEPRHAARDLIEGRRGGS
ncbi:hypothetical protein ACFWF7_16235 [Nocardia sp. NPDC060256]